ncbi:phosphatidylinositol synthase [Dichomitus squalens]|uniref:CDP-diacylglycerol--inositol 3-phosphatidyltransferase n=1 Tax=Dichomitus squalens TaxID=114155 RepID=A0A4Q9N9Y8_9APHY|nr:phosphatidylinositol synthase [Dichomitus squalens]TBU65705.1 phosphatidylinositol synthase [Dichomitus squalens]
MASNGNGSAALTRRRPSIDIVDAKVAVDLATAQTYSENVFLFVPNLIGYTRVILAALSLHYMSYHPKYCTVLYCISCLLDAVDGHAARALGQASKFGAVLDMVTDRCTTSCLLCYLTSAYPEWALAFQFLITLDFSSHYMHMNSSLITGSRSHKQVDGDVSRLLQRYYDPRTLFVVCAGNELFYISLYLMKWVHTPLSESFGITGDGFVAYLVSFTWPELIAYVTGPICALKNIVNLVQLWKASKVLVGVDLAERAKAREEQLLKKH